MTAIDRIRNVRLVDLDEPHGSGTPPVDVRVADGRVLEIGELGEPTADERVLDAGGRWMLPGLWDRHVHLDQWAAMRDRIDLAGCSGPAAVTELVAARIASQPGDAPVFGMGYRSSAWPERPRTAALDAVARDRVVVLISGDGHNGWMSTAAMRRLGLDLEAHATALDEEEWFSVFSLLHTLEDEERVDRRAADALREAAAVGVVGIVDMEFGHPAQRWTRRAAAGAPATRVRAAVYPEAFDALLAQGVRTGDDLAPGITMGPLKIITDGSLGTLTAHCCEPYLLPAGDERAAAHPCGKQNVPADRLEALLSKAGSNGMQVAVHAIGDRAIDIALDAFEATSTSGGIEHAQLLRTEAIGRLAQLGVEASVQPAHLLDDSAVMDAVWADRTERCFPLRSMLDAGVVLAMGSDAPVSALDPWLAIDAAVQRSADGAPWHPEQAITRSEALAASTDGVRAIVVGGPADLVVVDDDPRTASPAGPVWATLVAGTLAHLREEGTT